MYPLLFEVFGYGVRSFDVLVAAAFLFGTWVAAIRLREMGHAPEFARTLVVWILLGSFLGAKLYYATDTSLREGGSFPELFFGSHGVTFYGGLFGGSAGGLLAAWIHGVPMKVAADAVAVSCAMGQAIGRVGCFFNGDDYGSATDLPWGVVFPGGAAEGPVHPAQLYEALWLFPVSLLLWFRRQRSPFLFGEYLVLNGIGRFFVELVRTNPRFAGLSEPQWIGIALVGGASLMWIHFHRMLGSVPRSQPLERP